MAAVFFVYYLLSVCSWPKGVGRSIKCCVDQLKSHYKAKLEKIDLIMKITFTRLVKNFKIVLFSQNGFRYC